MRLMSDLIALLKNSNFADDEVVVCGDSRVSTRASLHAWANRLPVRLRHQAVALKISDPHDFVEALFAVDGNVSSLTILAPDLPADLTALVMQRTGATVLLEQLADLQADRETIDVRLPPLATQWCLTTSGTTGLPKVVIHDFKSLVRVVKPTQDGRDRPVWGLLYDPSRFAGLQVLLQAIGGGGRLVVMDPHHDIARRITVLIQQGCTHLSATPSIWRKILMLPIAEKLALRQITLGGEIADSRLLNALHARYPSARISHIYASTEAGVGFAVTDRQAGFPVKFLEASVNNIALKIVDGVLWVRPPLQTATPAGTHIRIDADGFICTEDRVDVTGDRVMFLGRESTLVNVGGVKLQLEVLERKLREHPGVSECVFSPIPSPILGSVLLLQIMPNGLVEDEKTFKREIKAWCRAHLQFEAVPAKIDIVNQLTLASSGKMQRV
jgi:acyl-CoA synthetase (AMP-forming)/AMP-acid ligase II